MRSLPLAAAVASTCLLISGCGSRDESKAAEDVRAAPTPIEQSALSPSDQVPAGMPAGTTVYRESFPDGKPRARGYVCDGKPIGPFEYAYENGRLRSKGVYRYGGITDGTWTHWYENGQRQMQGTYRLGKRHGPWSFWHPTGHIAAEGAYVDDRRHGAWRSWHANGQLASRGSFAHDLRVGMWEHFDERGDSAGYAVERETPRSQGYDRYKP